ncbi:RNA-binding protein [Lactococcus lactis]|uniref:RNA-binding protein n=1 Tax=Lactococcus lactis TaxID=1358 RepID=UPI003D0D48E8
MIGQVENITRFGLFVKISTDKLADKAVSKNRGLLRWSQIPKNVPKVQIGDLIGVEISKIHEDGKVDLNYQEKNFKNVYAEFLETSHQRLTELEQKNRELN